MIWCTRTTPRADGCGRSQPVPHPLGIEMAVANLFDTKRMVCFGAAHLAMTSLTYQSLTQRTENANFLMPSSASIFARPQTKILS